MDPITGTIIISRPVAGGEPEQVETPCTVLVIEAERVQVGYEQDGKPVKGWLPHGHVKGVDTKALYLESIKQKEAVARPVDPRIGKVFHVKIKDEEFDALVLAIEGGSVTAQPVGKDHRHTFPEAYLPKEVDAAPADPGVPPDGAPAPAHGEKPGHKEPKLWELKLGELQADARKAGLPVDEKDTRAVLIRKIVAGAPANRDWLEKLSDDDLFDLCAEVKFELPEGATEDQTLPLLWAYCGEALAK